MWLGISWILCIAGFRNLIFALGRPQTSGALSVSPLKPSSSSSSKPPSSNALHLFVFLSSKRILVLEFAEMDSVKQACMHVPFESLWKMHVELNHMSLRLKPSLRIHSKFELHLKRIISSYFCC